jgi:hypothetical protein
MKLIPLEQWICDTCQGRINQVSDGWVEWTDASDDGDYRPFGFHIVHHQSPCQYHGPRHLLDLPLSSFVGPNGLVRLLNILKPGPEFDPAGEFAARDRDEWCEFARRLQIPHYEEARQYWSLAEQDELFVDDATEVYRYSQESLTMLLSRYSK